jgi:hypothetical protein
VTEQEQGFARDAPAPTHPSHDALDTQPQRRGEEERRGTTMCAVYTRGGEHARAHRCVTVGDGFYFVGGMFVNTRFTLSPPDSTP